MAKLIPDQVRILFDQFYFLGIVMVNTDMLIGG